MKYPLFLVILFSLFSFRAQSQCTGVAWPNGVLTAVNAPSTCASLGELAIGAKCYMASGEIYEKTGAVGVNTWLQVSVGGSSATAGFTPITASSTTIGTSSTDVQNAIADCLIGVKRDRDSITSLHRAELNTLNSKRHELATVTDGTKIDFTASGTDNQTFTATVIAGSLDSLDLGDLKTSPRRLNTSGGLVNQFLTINAAGTGWTPSYGRVFIRSVSANTTLSWTTDRTAVVTASNVTVTLPTAVGWAGQYFTVKQGQAVNTVINTTSSQTIDGLTSIILSNTYDSVTLVSDGANWLII